MTNWEKYFGTPKNAAFSAYLLDCGDVREMCPELSDALEECAGSIDRIEKWLESEADHD